MANFLYPIPILFALLFLTNFSSFAQTETPFNPKQIKWVNKHGFESENYDWQNEKVNLRLKKAITFRNMSRASFGVWVSSFIIGSAIVYSSSMSGGPHSSEPDTKKVNTFYLASSILLTSTIVISIDAKNKVKQANRMKMKIGQ